VGDGNEDIGLELGVVLPHQPDDRGVREAQAGIPIHAFVDPLAR